MNRRNAVFALTGAMTTSLLTTTPFRPAAAQTVRRLGTGDYQTQTLAAGTFAKETSQLAVQQAADPRVKEFAQFEINEQTAIAQVLTNRAAPPPAPLEPRQAGMLQSLKALQGRAFDAAYVQGQMQGHQELLAIQEGYLKRPPASSDLEHIAVLARMSILQHITMLQDLQNAIKT